ncbi:MAG: RNA-binding protein [Mucilaginibacter polytrichastri]|nr:RNA-binding protein [Mucilaginibacter polytrichastri]
MNIFVGSLPYKVDEQELKQVFEQFGEVTSAKLIMDRETGRSKGFGFVEMSDDEDARKAIEDLNGSQLYGREIAVKEAEERKPRSDFRGGGGGGNRGGGGGYNRGGGGGYGRERNY